LRCKLLKYQGPGYDGIPLDDAEEIATQLLTQFSQDLAAERDRVAQVRAGIRAQRALREWDMAEYYAKGKYYGAAKMYYARIVDDYSDPRLAEESRSRMEQIKGEPDNPGQPFQWLVDILPQTKKEGPVVPKSLLAKQPDTTTTTR